MLNRLSMDYLVQEENLEGRDHLEELDVYKMIILKRVLMNSDWRA